MASITFKPLKKPLRAEIPRKAIYRLSVYLRCLQRLKINGIRTVSSEALSKAARVKSTQLRKDLTYFGQFGTRGLGYDVEQLSQMISDLLGTTSLQPVILVGVGNLGLALLTYRGFEQEGFEIIAAFDLDASRKRDKAVSTPIYETSRVPEIVQKSGTHGDRDRSRCRRSGSDEHACELRHHRNSKFLAHCAPRSRRGHGQQRKSRD